MMDLCCIVRFIVDRQAACDIRFRVLEADDCGGQGWMTVYDKGKTDSIEEHPQSKY